MTTETFTRSGVRPRSCRDEPAWISGESPADHDLPQTWISHISLPNHDVTVLCSASRDHKVTLEH